MRITRWSLSLTAVFAALALAGTGGKMDAWGAAPESTATCVSGGVSTVTLISSVKDVVQLDWADAGGINLGNDATVALDAKTRSFSVPTPEGAQTLSVFIVYSSKGTAHGGNVTLEVPCT